MSDKTRILAGDCTVRFEGTRNRIQRGHVVILVKPDRTVLVHDADGYQPVAWLTRPDGVTIEHDAEGFSLRAHTDSQELLVTSNRSTDLRSYEVSEAGIPVGDCSECGGPLVRTRGEIQCLDCDAEYGLPAGATVLDTAGATVLDSLVSCVDFPQSESTAASGSNSVSTISVVRSRRRSTSGSTANGTVLTVARRFGSEVPTAASSSAVTITRTARPRFRSRLV